MSLGQEWLRLDRVTVARVSKPARPLTLMVEGYGVALE